MSKKRKLWGAIILAFVLVVGYFVWQNMANKKVETKYVLAKVEKGDLIKNISGSGQVSVSNQVDVKPKVSGDVISVAVSVGQSVKAGDIIAQINARDAYKAVRDAQANLASAKLSLTKLQQPADDLSILQAENSLAQAQESKQSSQEDLQKAYDDGFNDVANAFLDLPNIISGIYTMLYGSAINISQSNMDYYTDSASQYDLKALSYRDDVTAAYNTARSSYDKNFSDYKVTDRFSNISTIEALINETYGASKNIAQLVKSANNLIQFYEDQLSKHDLKPLATADTYLSSLNTYTGKINNHIASLLSIKQTIQKNEQAIIDADRTIAEKTASLSDLKAGTDLLDLQAQQLVVQQRQNALLDAQQELADYVIKAPFDGVIAALDVKKGDIVSSATAIATLITKQQMAEISLNEVDAATVRPGQKAVLTFDAVSDLTISGEVGEVDTLGTVSQGVVTYGVKIVFDIQDERVRPGMSASVSIITDLKQGVLLLATAAVKSSGENYYVEVPNEELDSAAATASTGVVLQNQLKQQAVQIGIANDSLTEISSGLSEGDLVILRSISSGSSTNNTNSSSQGKSIFQMTGGGPQGRP
ncbi:MAG: HlyD family efflux transporter periplasmic adaptor subunit [Patescibacteria group bacterium]